MTTRDQARRAIGRRGDDARRASSAEWDDGRPRLPERLVAAREAKGVDLYRAERDTKIRARYLAALEQGDYGALPGAVYTKGFLRNYAQYLGLNSDEILEQWRRERGPAADPQPVAVVTRPVTMPRQGITLSRGMLVLALLLIVSIGIGGFLGSRLLPYLAPPTITVSHPATAVETIDGTTTAYTFKGTANAGATIIITADDQDLDPFLADASGNWTYEYKHLHLGTNLFEVKATNPDTQRTSAVIEIRIIVRTPQQTPGVTPTITLTSPEDEATFQNGAIPVAGTTTGKTVTVKATYIGPPGTPTPSASPSPSTRPSASPTVKPSPTATPRPSANASGSPQPSGSPGASGAPAPVTVPVNTDGTFSTSYQLPPGKWDLAVTASNDQGLEQTVHRMITVQFKGVQVTIRVKGGSAWIKTWKDGVVEGSPRVYRDGETITISAEKSVWIRTGVASVTYVTVNGVDYGQLSKDADVGSWRLEANTPPKPSNDV